jgi:hypothetical protein
LISRIFAMVTLPVTCSSRWENVRTRLWMEQQIPCPSSTAQQLGNIIAPTFLHTEFQFEGIAMAACNQNGHLIRAT